jgi:hypothetical protein
MNECIELFFGFAAFVASRSMLTELAEFLVRQESACLQGS